MRGRASSRTVSASTDPSAPAEAPGAVSAHPALARRRFARALAPAAAAWNAAGERVSQLWATPAWRRAKSLADRLLLLVLIAAAGWAITNGVFVAQRAIANRTVVRVHLAGLPTVKVLRSSGGAGGAQAVLPAALLPGTRVERIAVTIANDSPDGVQFESGTLTGPYLAASVALAPEVRSYIGPSGTIRLVGTVTVDCNAAGQVAAALIAGQASPEQAPTTVAVTVADTSGAAHRTILTVDTTAFAVQGQVCTV